MITTTVISYVNTKLKTRGDSVDLQIEHGHDTKTPYGIDIGCISEWLSDADMDELIKAFKKA